MLEILALLASTPGKLRRELQNSSLAEMKKRPASDKWSVREILAQLADVETTRHEKPGGGDRH